MVEVSSLEQARERRQRAEREQRMQGRPTIRLEAWFDEKGDEFDSMLGYDVPWLESLGGRPGFLLDRAERVLFDMRKSIAQDDQLPHEIPVMNLGWTARGCRLFINDAFFDSFAGQPLRTRMQLVWCALRTLYWFAKDVLRSTWRALRGKPSAQ